MRIMTFDQAVESALAQAMAADSRIIIFGEDVPLLRMNLLSRFGKDRVRPAPISEAAFVGAAVGAAMAGLKPVVEIMFVDFAAVAADALINHAAKVETFSGGDWKVPLVVRTACGGGYGDAGQHEQSLWGWLAHIPGLNVIVPSTPADAGGLMLGALAVEKPVVFMEHKMLSWLWLDYMGLGGRKTVTFDVPAEGAEGSVPDEWKPLRLGQAMVRRAGKDVTIVSVGLAVHRALEAAVLLEREGFSAGVVDLRSISPLDRETVCGEVGQTGRLLVVDEDYREFGLSGELAASVLEAGLNPKFGRVCTESTIPYSRTLEDETLPTVRRIVEGARRLLAGLKK
jgi:pyruvate/2-oxoglutarate/acetoin dehydrogenase E1 component